MMATLKNLHQPKHAPARKQCSKCNCTLDIAKFPASSKSVDGFANECRLCNRERKRNEREYRKLKNLYKKHHGKKDNV